MFHLNVEFHERDGAPPPAKPRPRKALRDFGFDEDFLRDYLGVAAESDRPARVVAVHRGRYETVLEGPDGEALAAEAVPAGRLSHEAASAAALPAVGDWVVLRGEIGAGQNGGPFLLTEVLPRRSAFARKAPGKDPSEAQVIAANVDYALIVTAAGRNYSLRRIERYLTLAREAGVSPIVVISKADLAEDSEALAAEAAKLAPEAPCLAVSAVTGEGLEGLRLLLEAGKTFVLLGSSGAGKSTLLNALAGHDVAATGEIRAADERGRHTTTARELHRLESGALVIDNPGMRELQLWAGEEAVEAAFPEIEAFAAACRFRDCRHEAEPGCAVRAALETGEIDPARYASYEKLAREVAHLERRDDLGLQRAEAERWKAINRKMRGYSKERRAIEGKSF